jgi:lactobin A/cerein 7B family class IIb bacteriocin
MMENKFELNKFAMVSDTKLQEVDGGIAPIVVAGAAIATRFLAGQISKQLAKQETNKYFNNMRA